MDQKKKVLILFGGESSEHKISGISAASVLEHMDREKYEIRVCGITEEGTWYLTGADPARMQDGSWKERADNRRMAVSLDKSRGGFLAFGRDGSCEKLEPDVVFPVLHGKNGEDGTVQGLLEMAGLRYVGSGTGSSAACMDKAVAKAVIEQAEAAEQAKCCIVHRAGCDPAEAAEGIDLFFRGNYPLFVKPSSAGSSVGVTKVASAERLTDAMRTAFAEDDKILIEEAIEGRELEVAVLGNDDPAASCIGEIFSAHDFYDYEAKYEDRGSRTAVADDLPAELQEEIRETAVRIYRLLQCRGLARVDFFLKQDGTVVFNEVNTMPGFTSISMYPALWEADGLPYGDLIDRLIGLALEE